MKPRGVVYLVGAGPGDPGLLTLRGAEVLARADVVLYDRLVNAELLALAPHARRVDVGKRHGESAAGQGEINDLMVAEARRGRTVVRLKGGDPFVFGRGGEECEVLAGAGVPFEIVPGVTSAVAGPAYAGIPLTHREYASWAAIATGHEDPSREDSTLDWDAIARAGTSVFLMGMGRLANICSSLVGAGRDPSTPAAVVASATLPSQRVVRSTLGSIASEAEGVEPPALLVVGEVAGLAERLDWFGRRPLSGKRVFVTRTREQAGKLSRALRELGAFPLEHPAIRIMPPDDPGPLDAALGNLHTYEWVVFTSPNAVDAVEAHLASAGRDARAFGAAGVAAIGPATAERLRDFGIRADLVPSSSFTSAAVGAEFPRGEGRVLLPRAADAPDELPRLLAEAGWHVETAAVYRTVPDASSVEAGRAALHAGVDAVCFTSGSTVRGFVELWGPPPPAAVVCCIGPVTAEVAGELGVRVDAVAKEHTIDGLVAALVEAVGG